MELVPMEINNELIASIGGDMSPIFTQVRIYGDLEEPLFVAKDVQTVLGLKNMHYKDNDSFLEWGKHKAKAKIRTKGGIQEAIVLTEQGLYKALYNSLAPIAEQFQTFVYVVMKRLRLKGSVTLDEAREDLRDELEKEQKYRKAIETDFEIEHKELVNLRHKIGIQTVTLYDQSVEVEKLKKKIENIKDPSLSELQERVTRLEHKYMRPVIVMLSAPPKEHEDVHTYELDYYSENDEDLLDSSETMIFSIGFSALKSKVAISKLFVHKEIKLDDLHRKLEMYRLPKTDSGYYQNAYEISLDLLRVIVDDLNREHESTW